MAMFLQVLPQSVIDPMTLACSPLSSGRRVETKLLLPNLLVLDVEPLVSPVLNRFNHLKVKIFGFRTDRYNGATNVMKGGFAWHSSGERTSASRGPNEDA
jgi:hypothetical protein